MADINKILHELSKHHRDKSTVLTDSINERLSKSIEVYYKELIASCQFLAKSDAARVLKNI